jgi:hypothetical protein
MQVAPLYVHGRLGRRANRDISWDGPVPPLPTAPRLVDSNSGYPAPSGYTTDVTELKLSLFRTQTPWPLVRKRTIPNEQPPLLGEIQCQLFWIEGCRVVSAADPLRSLISVF